MTDHNSGSSLGAKRSRKEKSKEIKKSIIEIANIPEMTSLPGTLDPLQFAKARTTEVMLMKKEIEESKFRSSKRVFQTLPRSMRRRAASYNIKRLPVRLRLRAMEESSKDPKTVQKRIKKPPCRSRKRRPSNIFNEFGRRQGNKRWLETHLWHAKRAHMEDFWGYRIAIKSNEKCLKSCIKSSRVGCFLYDSSYFEMISGNVLLDHLIFSLNPNFKDTILKFEGDSGYWAGDLYGVEGILLGPVKVGYRKNQDRKNVDINIIAHPLLSNHILSIDSSSLQLAQGKFSIFQLEGSKSHQILNNILQVTLPLRPGFHSQLLLVEDPRFNFPPPSLLKGATTHPKDPFSHDWGLFWDDSYNSKQLSLRRSERALNDRRSLNLIPGTKLNPSIDEPNMPILVWSDSSPLSDGRQHHTWTVIVPFGWGRSLWRSLIFSKGVRFGGLTEYNLVNFEHSRPTFPDDYVTSPSYKHFSLALACKQELLWKRKPPAKRINYEKLGIKSPFNIDLDGLEIDNLYICRLECEGRGVPTFNARVKRDDRIIGFVTTGHYSQVFGKGICFAMISAPKLEEVLTVYNINNNPPRFARLTQIFHRSNHNNME